MNTNLGTVLGGIALVVSLANSFFIYDLSKGKPEDFNASTPKRPMCRWIPNAAPNNGIPGMNPMDPSAQAPTTPPVPAGPPTTIAFKKMEHDFGNIKQESENPYEFEFTNTAKTR